MAREQFNGEMLSDLDTIRTDESTCAIRVARRTDVHPTAVGGVAFVKATVSTRSLRNEKYGRVGGLNSDS